MYTYAVPSKIYEDKKKYQLGTILGLTNKNGIVYNNTKITYSRTKKENL
jgi:hypothetical protein